MEPGAVDPPPPGAPPPRPRAWTWRLVLVWAAPILVLGCIGAAVGASRPSWRISDIFFAHDVAAALATVPLLVVLVLARPGGPRWARLDSPRLAICLSVAAAAIAVAGSRLVMLGYPLSMDEFMASFDAAIFREGRLFAVAPEAWRPFRLALLPQFNLLAPDGASWASTYLPVNAMVLAGAQRLGTYALAGAGWTLLAAAALYGIARRLWPERRDAAVLAVVLLVTSTQTLFAAMTPYAMPAHLALNLTWLWLFLRGGRASQVSAAGVAFIACGLHQVVFHPLFAAPFLLQALIQRRWGRVAFHAVAYAAIGIFWLSYWRLFLPGGVAAAAGGGASGMGIWLARIELVTRNFSLDGLAVMAKNLFRFLTWQNPAAVALGLVGAGLAVWRGGVPRYAALGLLLMLAVMVVVMPYQGHGWGYRYLHGLLGSLCLLAALAWVRLTSGAAEESRQSLAVGVLALTAASLVVLLPLRAWQVRSFITPYAEAMGAIRNANVDVVMVDTTGMQFGGDLVRNDPWLRNRPKVMDLYQLRPAAIRTLCSRYEVAVFDRASGSRIRPFSFSRTSVQRLAQKRRLMDQLGCGGARVQVR